MTPQLLAPFPIPPHTRCYQEKCQKNVLSAVYELVCVCVRLSVFSRVTLQIDRALPRGPLLVEGGACQGVASGRIPDVYTGPC